MALLQHILHWHRLFSPLNWITQSDLPSHCVYYPSISIEKHGKSFASTSSVVHSRLSLPNFLKHPFQVRENGLRACRAVQKCESGDGKEKEGEELNGSEGADDFMSEEERKEWRNKIREVINMHPHVDQELDPVKRRNRVQKLLADYPPVVEEDDPDWPEDAEGWGFNLSQFFNKITIKNAKKDDDENYDSENELVWQDDDYICSIKDITTAEWEETVFKDISPLVILVHNRYKRPKENEKIRNELEKAVNIIWNCSLPSPRCVAIDAVVELELVSTLQISVFPELIFTKSGKILYRERGNRTADELSKIMAFFYYGATKPPCLNHMNNNDEAIPNVAIKTDLS